MRTIASTDLSTSASVVPTRSHSRAWQSCPATAALTDDDDLKMHAVFVLSQLPRSEGIPQLLEIARSNPSWRVRSQALFWLGQSGDSRAIALFESVLRP